MIKFLFLYAILFFLIMFLNSICFAFFMTAFSMFFSSVSLDTLESFNISMLLSSTVPIKIYFNADLNKNTIIQENKDKSGVYQFTNLLTGKSYVGSSTNLSRRFSQYYSYN